MPAEVYEHPATEFVAGFVGTSNVITTSRGRSVLRPEKIEIVAGTESLTGAGVHGVILDVAYVGMVTRFRVTSDAGESMTVVRQNRSSDGGAESLASGDAVTLRWREEDATSV